MTTWHLVPTVTAGTYSDLRNRQIIFHGVKKISRGDTAYRI